MQSAVPPEYRPTMRWSAKGFAAFLSFMALLLAVLTALVAPVVQLSFLSVYPQVLFWIGLAYILASLLAWTGFANLYRCSPTLFVGSRSYRARIAKGDMYREGRDEESLLIGSLFGLALMGLGGLLGLLTAEGASWVSIAALAAAVAFAGLVARLARRRRAASASTK